MARVDVVIYTTLKDKLGFSRKMIEAKTLKDVIKKLCLMKKGIDKILLENENKVKGIFVITVNSKIVDNSKILKIKLKDGDIINIFPPVSGG